MRLFVVALLIRLIVIGASYVTPRQLALRDYGPSVASCSGTWRYLNRRPECVVLAEDERAYDALGRNIAAGRGFLVEQEWVLAQPGQPTAYGNFLYPAFVGAVYAIGHDSALALLVLQALLGSAAVCGMAWAAGRLGGHRAYLAAGVLGAAHPGLALNSAWVMSEALAVPLLVAAYLAWVRWLERETVSWACAFGALAAAAALTRSPALLALGLMVALSVRGRRIRPAAVAAHAAVAVAVFAACIAPWAIRNARQFHAFVPTDTKQGANLWLFNHPTAHPLRDVWDGTPQPVPPPGPVPGLNEAGADRHFRGLALQYVTSQPLTFAAVSAARLGLSLVPVPRYWGRWPALRALVAAAYVGLTWLAIAGFWMARRDAAGRALAGIALGWFLLMSLTAVGLRHRMSAEWVFVVGAGVAVAGLLPQRPAQSRS